MSYALAGSVFGLTLAFVVTAIIVCTALVSVRREETRDRRITELDDLAGPVAGENRSTT